METAEHATRTRGRPRQFDEEQVLAALTELFWERGFEASSLSDIVESAGLNKSSLYNAFGSKEELFQLVLNRYIEERLHMMAEMTSGDGGLDDVLSMIDMLQLEALDDGGQRGCLALNSTAELGLASAEMRAVAQRFRAAMRANLRRPLERAAERGEIPADLIDTYADATMSFVVATSLTARGGAPSDEIVRHLDSMRALVRSWRTS